MSITARRVVRFAVATLFWANALFLVRFHPAAFSRWAEKINLTVPEATIILAIAVVTLLRSNGLWKFSVDLAYLYFFPFVLLFYAWKLVRAALKLMRYIPTGAVIARTGHQITAASDTIEVNKAPNLLTSAGFRRSAPQRMLDLGLMFFLQSTLLWGLLIVLSSHKVVLETATVVVLLHLARALFRAWGIGRLSYTWLKKVRGQMRPFVESIDRKSVV